MPCGQERLQSEVGRRVDGRRGSTAAAPKTAGGIALTRAGAPWQAKERAVDSVRQLAPEPTTHIECSRNCDYARGESYDMPTLHARTLRRALEIVGGVDVLAARLGARGEDIEHWLEDKVPAPQEVFLRCVDIVVGHEVEEISGGHAKPKQ
jgi:hypothetical protein